MEAYGWLALVPPVLAIVLAIWTRQVFVSLFLGIFAGATIIAGWNPLEGLLNSFSTYLVSNSLADSWNIGIIVFCLVIGVWFGLSESLAVQRQLQPRWFAARSLQELPCFRLRFWESLCFSMIMRIP